MVKWVSTVGFNPELQSSALASLVSIATQHRDLLSDGEYLFSIREVTLTFILRNKNHMNVKRNRFITS